MKVTAFIRKTSAKNNVTNLHVSISVSGTSAEWTSRPRANCPINPNHWSPERQGYKPRVALVSEEKKMNFDKDVQQITTSSRRVPPGVDGSWLKA